MTRTIAQPADQLPQISANDTTLFTLNSIQINRSGSWLMEVAASVRESGLALVQSVLDPELLAITRGAMYEVRGEITTQVGEHRLNAAGELGVLRLMMLYRPQFLRFLELPPLLEILDSLLSPTAILHTQNGFILPSMKPEETPVIFQNQFHMDFPRYLNGYVASINAFFPITDFSSNSGATIFAVGSHQRAERPTETEIRSGVAVECPAGSMIVFDSTLWHAAGRNVSGADRLAINQQFTRSFFKQQLDYVRALGVACLESLPPRTQQILGWYTRVPTSLDEYYQPTEKRLYRSGQG